MGTVHVIDHPLIQHKLTWMRRKDTRTNDFRALLREISMLLAYEVCRDMSTVDVDIETPGIRTGLTTGDATSEDTGDSASGQITALTANSLTIKTGSGTQTFSIDPKTLVLARGAGAPATATGRGTPAVLHAYDGATGKRLWNSGTAMTAFASPQSFWSNGGQVYVGTHDGTLYAFGFNDERRPTTSQ